VQHHSLKLITDVWENANLVTILHQMDVIYALKNAKPAPSINLIVYNVEETEQEILHVYARKANLTMVLAIYARVFY